MRSLSPCSMISCSTTSTTSGGTSRSMCPRMRDAASSRRKCACPVARHGVVRVLLYHEDTRTRAPDLVRAELCSFATWSGSGSNGLRRPLTLSVSVWHGHQLGWASCRSCDVRGTGAASKRAIRHLAGVGIEGQAIGTDAASQRAIRHLAGVGIEGQAIGTGAALQRAKSTWLASGSRAKRLALARRRSVRFDTLLASRAKRLALALRRSVRPDTWLASGSSSKRLALARRRSVRSDAGLASGTRAKRLALARRCSERRDICDGAASSSTVASDVKEEDPRGCVPVQGMRESVTILHPLSWAGAVGHTPTEAPFQQCERGVLLHWRGSSHCSGCAAKAWVHVAEDAS